MGKIDRTAIEVEYSEHSFRFERVKDALIAQIEELFKSNDIKLGFPIQARIKSVESIIEKQESKRFTIKKSILELNDLIGFRVILLFNRDVQNVCELIKENFDLIKEKNSFADLQHNQFGYSSIHYTVKIPEGWLKVPTLKNLEKYTAEIQIRTLSQHTWAETSNLLQYKNESNVPPEILRSIGRVSALLEIVDLELERTLQDRDNYNTKISKSFDLDHKLNVDLFSKIMDEKMPEYIEKSNLGYSDILQELNYFGISTAGELMNLIDTNLKFHDHSVEFYIPNENIWEIKPPQITLIDDSIISYSLICLNIDKWWEFIDQNRGTSGGV